MLYSVAALESGMAQKVTPLLIYINKAQNRQREDFVVQIGKNKIDDASVFRDDFKNRLQDVLREIFDINTEFTPTDNEERCQWCDFKKLCERKEKKEL